MTDLIGVPLPLEFVKILRDQLGEECQGFISAHQQNFRKSIRLNKMKGISADRDWEPVPWCENGFFIHEKWQFSQDPLFHGGAYYVQEASSMFLDHVLRCIRAQLPDNSIVLDLCGAPGGKTLILADGLHPNSLIISNEVLGKRWVTLRHNVEKWGRINVFLTQSDPSRFKKLAPIFDLVLIDAPCSGEGLFRKDPKSISQWSPDNVRHCALRQRRILNAIIPIIKPGGFMIYSTCSYNDEENIGQIQGLIEKDFKNVQIRTDPNWRIITKKEGRATGYQFYPHRTSSEGFFISILRKKTETNSFNLAEIKVPVRQKLRKIENRGFFPVKSDYSDSLYFNSKNEVIYAEPKWMKVISYLRNFMRLTPLYMGSLHDDIFIPYHALSLSCILDSGVPRISLDKESSLRFLQKEELKTNDVIPGWQVATFNEIPMGWLKGVGNRYKNYYPTQFRIRN